MFKTKRRRRRKRVTFIQRFFRGTIAVVILSAFILGISLTVKETANLDPYQIVKLAGPLLDKIGISTEQAGQVAGSFAERVLKTNIAPSVNYKEEIGGLSGDEGAATSRNMVFKTAFFYWLMSLQLKHSILSRGKIAPSIRICLFIIGI